MGTRADFYIGRGEGAEWLGSIAWDGYPDGIPEELLKIRTGEKFKPAIKRFLESRDDGTLPENGWPWPWDDSNTTDYAYALDSGMVYASCFGSDWFDPTKEQSEDEEDERSDKGKTAVFPNMKERKNMTLGARSGLIVMTGA